MSTEPRIQLSGTNYFWLQVSLLTAGVVGVWISHYVGSWYDASAPGVIVTASAVVACSVGAVGRATKVIVDSAFSDSYRVFRSRHLLACSALLLVGATAVAIPLITQEPFDELFAHGAVTGGEIADLASACAMVICTIGAVVAATGAWDVLRDERHWYRSPNSGSGQHM
jgi:hypothetical protein